MRCSRYGSCLGRRTDGKGEVKIIGKELVMSYLKSVTKFSAVTEAIHGTTRASVCKQRIKPGTPSIRYNNNCLPCELLQ